MPLGRDLYIASVADCSASAKLNCAVMFSTTSASSVPQMSSDSWKVSACPDANSMRISADIRCVSASNQDCRLENEGSGNENDERPARNRNRGRAKRYFAHRTGMS